jgi:hypothetical protein
LELGVRSQESGGKRKKEEIRSQKKCFYKYEMLPIGCGPIALMVNLIHPGFPSKPDQ